MVRTIQFKIYVRNVHSIDIPKQTVEMSIWFESFGTLTRNSRTMKNEYVTDDEEGRKFEQETTDTHGHVYEPA